MSDNAEVQAQDAQHDLPTLRIPNWFLAGNVFSIDHISTVSPRVELVDKVAYRKTSEKKEIPKGKDQAKAEDDGESGGPSTDSSSPPDLAQPVEISKDTFDELCDIVATVLASKIGESVSGKSATVLLATKAKSCDHVAEALLLELARKLGAGLVALDLEDLEDIAEDFDRQYKEHGAYLPRSRDPTEESALAPDSIAKLLSSPPEQNEDENAWTDSELSKEAESSRPASEETSSPDETPPSTKSPERPASEAAGFEDHDKTEDEDEDDDKAYVNADDDKTEDEDEDDDKAYVNADDKKTKDATDYPDQPNRTEPNCLSAFFFAPSVHHSSLAIPRYSYQDGGITRRDAAILAVLGSGLRKGKSCTMSASQEESPTFTTQDTSTASPAQSPLLVMFRNSAALSKTELHRGFIETILAQICRYRQSGQQVVLFVPTTFDSCEPQRSGLFGCYCSSCESSDSRPFHPVKLFKTDEAFIVKLHGKFTEDPHVVTRSTLRQLRRSLRQQLNEEAISTELEPCNEFKPEQLEAVAKCESALIKNTGDFARVLKQLCGRALTQSFLDTTDIIEVLQRNARRNAESLAEIAHLSKLKDDSTEKSDDSESESQDEDDEDDKRSYDQYEQALLTSKVNAKHITETFEDVIMDENTLNTVKQLLKIALMRTSKTQNKLLAQLQVPGIILHGPPGTGKTQLVRAIANSMKANMLALEGADIQDKYVGETESRIRAAFTLARKLHPCILFLDEADALFYRRGSDDKSWQRTALNQFLTEMDGLSAKKERVLVIVATNRVQDIDEAFMRRLPHKVKFVVPDQDARAKILRLQLKDLDIGDRVNIDDIAKMTPGYTGSDLRNLCQSAMLTCISNQAVDFDDAKELSASDICLQQEHFITAIDSTKPPAAATGTGKEPEWKKRLYSSPVLSDHTTLSLGQHFAIVVQIKEVTPTTNRSGKSLPSTSSISSRAKQLSVLSSAAAADGVIDQMLPKHQHRRLLINLDSKGKRFPASLQKLPFDNSMFTTAAKDHLRRLAHTTVASTYTYHAAEGHRNF